MAGDQSCGSTPASATASTAARPPKVLHFQRCFASERCFASKGRVGASPSATRPSAPGDLQQWGESGLEPPPGHLLASSGPTRIFSTGRPSPQRRRELQLYKTCFLLSLSSLSLLLLFSGLSASQRGGILSKATFGSSWGAAVGCREVGARFPRSSPLHPAGPRVLLDRPYLYPLISPSQLLWCSATPAGRPRGPPCVFLPGATLRSDVLVRAGGVFTFLYRYIYNEKCLTY